MRRQIDVLMSRCNMSVQEPHIALSAISSVTEMNRAFPVVLKRRVYILVRIDILKSVSGLGRLLKKT